MTFTWGTSTCIARESLIHLSVDQLFKTMCWKSDYILPDINESSLGRLRTLQLDVCSQELMKDVPCQAGWMCWWHNKCLNPGNMPKAGQYLGAVGRQGKLWQEWHMLWTAHRQLNRPWQIVLWKCEMPPHQGFAQCQQWTSWDPLVTHT